MPRDRWIDIETAKKLLRNTCDFLRVDDSGIADFRIEGREGILMSAYTSAFFMFDEKYKIEIRAFASAFHAFPEPISLVPFQEEYRADVIPILSRSISSYFRFFPDLTKPKYLFLVKGSDYTSRRGYFSRERMIEDMTKKIKAQNLKPYECLLWPSVDDTYGEDFWEYISGIILRTKGYLITYYSLGGGDLWAYYIPEYIQKLSKKGFLNKGAFIEELEMLEIQNEQINIDLDRKYESVCIEAESSEMRTRSGSEGAGVGQLLKKYMSDWEAGYTHGFVAGPFTKLTDIYEKDRRKVGLISCDEDGNLVYHKGEPYREPSEEKIGIIKNVIKCSLLKNLTLKERCNLLGIKPMNLSNYYEKILNLDIDAILDKIYEKLN